MEIIVLFFIFVGCMIILDNRVKHFKLKENMSILDFTDQLENVGVLGSGKIAKASILLSEMIKDPDMSIFFSMAGPMVPGGLRYVVADLIKKGYIDALFTSGANLTHDLLESFGGFHYSKFGFDDEELQKSGIGRIGDIYTKSVDFEVFEKQISDIISEIAVDRDMVSVKDFVYNIGLHIGDDDSIIKAASDNNVPVYAPGLVDSMLGLQLWMFNESDDLGLDVVADMHDLSDLVFDSKKVGLVILGGGLPKHYALASNILSGGVDAAIQITLDRGEGGSLSGAPLEEGKSWAKVKCGSNLVSVVGDATVLFPLILASALDKLD